MVAIFSRISPYPVWCSTCIGTIHFARHPVDQNKAALPCRSPPEGGSRSPSPGGGHGRALSVVLPPPLRPAHANRVTASPSSCCCCRHGCTLCHRSWPTGGESSRSASLIHHRKSTSLRCSGKGHETLPFPDLGVFTKRELAARVGQPMNVRTSYLSSHYLLTCTENMLLSGNKTSTNLSSWKNWNLKVLGWTIWNRARPIYIHPIFSYRNASAHSLAVGIPFQFSYWEEWLRKYTVIARCSIPKIHCLTIHTVVLSILITYLYLKR